MTDKPIDITKVMSAALKCKKNSEYYAQKIRKLKKAMCDVEFDNNDDWYTVDYDFRKIGYMSTRYPALFIQRSTPKAFKRFLFWLAIPYTYVDWDETVSCEPEVLKNFISNPYLYLIDDSFLNNYDVPFDYEAFEMIDGGARYINPYNFNIYDLKEW